MSHTLQERYSSLVDAKLRDTLVLKDGIVFNTRYEGQPTAGAVKIPVRDGEVTAGAYSKTAGKALTNGTTTYKTLSIDHDIAVNELIDGYDAAAVPDNITADRLDSAAYSLAKSMEADAYSVLEDTTSGTGTATLLGTAVLTAKTVYAAIVAARTALSKANVPTMGRFLIVSPDVYALLLQDTDNFIRSTQLGDDVVANGAVGKIAGFTVYEGVGVASTTNFIAGHPDWCVRVQEWQSPVEVVSLKGSGTYIGASAVQGRKIFAHTVTKPIAVQVHKNA